MNFVIHSPDGRLSSRCDTTINRQNNDSYMPDEVQDLLYAPAVFVRISKTGKALEKQFLSRYYDAISFGMLLFPDGNTAYDYTTIVPEPLFNAVTLTKKENSYRIWKDGKEIFSTGVEQVLPEIEKALVEGSRYITVRRGDYVAAQLAQPVLLRTRSEGDCSIRAEYCGNTVTDIEIKF